jgi:hypothetical protein
MKVFNQPLNVHPSQKASPNTDTFMICIVQWETRSRNQKGMMTNYYFPQQQTLVSDFSS